MAFRSLVRLKLPPNVGKTTLVFDKARRHNSSNYYQQYPSPLPIVVPSHNFLYSLRNSDPVVQAIVMFIVNWCKLPPSFTLLQGHGLLPTCYFPCLRLQELITTLFS